MTLPRSVSDVLDKHVQFEIESIDRMYLNLYVPELQRAGQVAGFLMRHHGFPIASTALVAPMSRQFVTDIKTYAADRAIPLVHFTKGDFQNLAKRVERLCGWQDPERVAGFFWHFGWDVDARV